ncbi:unnamed protein product [Strongylus vulgaris]|uniref:F-box/LRR-repeat protein 15-like leucin rich repeat domain-containing protein n=1 Tax=Strongylus vulgaris TaxID=40348 RepID=A0A3P7JJ47_STRVU|nr:unnamed protein product [Strongylus vulgaris]
MAFEDLCTSAGSLKELRINDCYKISDENLSMISRTMPELRVFTLCGDRFEKLTFAGLSHITHMTSLVELALDYNSLVNDAFLLKITSALSNLKTLSLANAGSDQKITMKGLNAIANLKELEQLDLSSLAALRSGVLLEIAYSCRQLTLLQLRNCVYLSDDGVKGLARMKNIRHVDLSGSILKTSVTIVVGGTAADSSQLSVRGSRVVVDFSDYTSILSMPDRQASSFKIGSFYIDAVCGEEESPIEDERSLQEWAEREARNLGLIGK